MKDAAKCDKLTWRKNQVLAVHVLLFEMQFLNKFEVWGLSVYEVSDCRFLQSGEIWFPFVSRIHVCEKFGLGQGIAEFYLRHAFWSSRLALISFSDYWKCRRDSFDLQFIDQPLVLKLLSPRCPDELLSKSLFEQ